jgi:hypothetical protein
VFHPHGWIRSEQVVELIGHAVEKHGPKVKFLTFREAQDRLDRHLLAGQPLRDERGGDNGVRLLDLNADGYLDVVLGNERLRRTRIWSPEESRWRETGFPTSLLTEVRFGMVGDPVVLRLADESVGWRFDGQKWIADDRLSGSESRLSKRRGFATWTATAAASSSFRVRAMRRWRCMRGASKLRAGGA